MKIKIISDLHQEFGMYDLDFSNADIVVLAGDTNLGVKGIEWAKEKIKNKPVLYLLGNHEYYKGSYPKTLNKIIEASIDSNVIVLENKMVEFEGVRFHGTTLWTDFALFGDSIKYGMICQNQMSDYKRIRRDPTYSKLRTIDTFKIHQLSKLWLTESLDNSIGYQNIVITHHAPSIRSIPDLYKKDPISSAYASNLDDMIIKHEPKYWIHGHVHTPVRYHIGKTEIICNPHGYLDEPYNGYDRDLILEI